MLNNWAMACRMAVSRALVLLEKRCYKKLADEHKGGRVYAKEGGLDHWDYE